MEKESIAKKLVSIMEARGLNATELSKITGIKRSTLEGYIKASSLLKVDSLISICESLEISADYMLGLEELDGKTVPSSDQGKVLGYYSRLNEENKDYIKGEMVRLHREQEVNKGGMELSSTLDDTKKHA